MKNLKRTRGNKKNLKYKSPEKVIPKADIMASPHSESKSEASFHQDLSNHYLDNLHLLQSKNDSIEKPADSTVNGTESSSISSIFTSSSSSLSDSSHINLSTPTKPSIKKREVQHTHLSPAAKFKRNPSYNLGSEFSTSPYVDPSSTESLGGNQMENTSLSANSTNEHSFEDIASEKKTMSPKKKNPRKKKLNSPGTKPRRRMPSLPFNTESEELVSPLTIPKKRPLIDKWTSAGAALQTQTTEDSELSDPKTEPSTPLEDAPTQRTTRSQTARSKANFLATPVVKEEEEKKSETSEISALSDVSSSFLEYTSVGFTTPSLSLSADTSLASSLINDSSCATSASELVPAMPNGGLVHDTEFQYLSSRLKRKRGNQYAIDYSKSKTIHPRLFRTSSHAAVKNKKAYRRIKDRSDTSETDAEEEEEEEEEEVDEEDDEEEKNEEKDEGEEEVQAYLQSQSGFYEQDNDDADENSFAFHYDREYLRYSKVEYSKKEDEDSISSYFSSLSSMSSNKNHRLPFRSKEDGLPKNMAKLYHLSLQLEESEATISQLYRTIETLEASNRSLSQQISGFELDRAQNSKQIGLFSFEFNPMKLATLLQDFETGLDRFSRQLLVHPENKCNLRSSIQSAVLERLMPVSFRQHHMARFVCGLIYETLVTYVLDHHPLSTVLTTTSQLLEKVFVSMPSRSYVRDFYLHSAVAEVRDPVVWMEFVDTVVENMKSTLASIHIQLPSDQVSNMTSLVHDFLHVFYVVLALECSFVFPALGDRVSDDCMKCDGVLDPEDPSDLTTTDANGASELVVLFPTTPYIQRDDGVGDIFHKACVFAIHRPSQLDRFADVAATMDPLPVCDPPSEDDDLLMA